jgi:two-component system, LytTR family, sensor kinase
MTLVDPSRRLGSKELLLILIFWFSLALLAAVNRLFDPRGFGFRGIVPVGSLIFPFIEAAVWAVVTPFVLILANRHNKLAHIPLLLIYGVGIAIAVDLVLDLTRMSLFPVRAARRGGIAFAPFSAIGRFRFLNQFIVYLAVLAAGFAREFFIRGQQKQREAVELQGQLAQARLDALRMQINPHFLFNTLNAVSALVERDPAGVRRMIARLSDLLRYTLDKHGSEEVPLREELGYLEKYLDIMKVRFQGRLEVVTAIEPAALDSPVPGFILQPIVENALEHGVSNISGTGRVEIRAHREGPRLVISVSDNGPGLADQRDGVGLSNTRARLAQMYGQNASLTLRSNAGGGALAEITIG